MSGVSSSEGRWRWFTTVGLFDKCSMHGGGVASCLMRYSEYNHSVHPL